MSPRNVLLLSLSLVAAGEATLGIVWLRELRAGQAAMLSISERTALVAKLESAERRAGAAKKRLDDALNAPREATGGASVSALAGKGPGSSSEFEQHFRDALSNPAFRQKLAEAQKARLGLVYGPLFAQLGLSAEQLNKFQDLLVDKQLAKTEAGPLPAYDAQIQVALGEPAYSTYIKYEDTARLRAAVRMIAAGLNATDSPLAPDAANRLVESWYAALPAASKGHPTGLNAEVGAGLVPDYELPALPSNSAEIAQGILSAPQLAAFQRLIKAQAAQEQLRGIE